MYDLMADSWLSVHILSVSIRLSFIQNPLCATGREEPERSPQVCL